MQGIAQWSRRLRASVMAILTLALLLAGCGEEPTVNEELTTQTVSVEIEASEESAAQTVATDREDQETSGRFQYDERLYSLDLPVITEEQALADGKTILTLQTSLPNSWLKYLVAGFNRQSADYFIRREETGTDRLLTELMAGRGPDIITGDMLEVNESILQKGVLVDLAPGLDALGITDEEYFPSCRALRMGDSVYGIRARIEVHGISIREAVLDGEEHPDIKTLVEKLYTYPDQEAVWWGGARYKTILEYLLSGSEDLWGAIDWENGTCDFSSELFAKILEITKRYADPEGNPQGMEDRQLVNFYDPTTNPQKQLEDEGRVVINYPFDDGNYPAYISTGSALMLNASSEHQEGAWKFIEYVLGEEGQCYAAGICSVVPSREMTRNCYAHCLRLLEEGRMQTTAEYTPETIQELITFSEQGHEIPLRTKEILNIIYEEVPSFCNGDKPLEEVCDVIQKRVQIYISETT